LSILIVEVVKIHNIIIILLSISICKRLISAFKRLQTVSNYKSIGKRKPSAVSIIKNLDSEKRIYGKDNPRKRSITPRK